MTPEPSVPGSVDLLTPVPANGDHWFVPGSGLVMRGIQRVIADAAPTDISILLMGERGTGKEVLALHIHRLSHRREQPFNKVNCAGLTADGLRHYLTPGAQGNGAEAPGGAGTLLLDEVSELDAVCQSVMMDFFSDCEQMSGRAQLGPRIICSSCPNLEERMRAGYLREEFFSRINAICLCLPPLRHRREDIPAFLSFFLRKSASQLGRPQPTLSAGALQALLEHSWPGNVRELEQAMEQVIALGDECLDLESLRLTCAEPPRREKGSKGISLKEAARAASRSAERELMLKVLMRTRWNRKSAARELQISYKALLYKLKLLGLEASPSA